LNTTHNGFNLSLGRYTILERTATLVTHVRDVGVHEANRDTIGIEKGRGKGNAFQDEPKVLDTASFLLKLHGTAVVNVQHDIIQGQLDNVVGDLLGNAPALDDLVDQRRGALGDLIYLRRIRGVEGLELLLLDARGEKLLIRSNFSRAALDLLGRLAVLLLLTILLGRLPGLTILAVLGLWLSIARLASVGLLLLLLSIGLW
jgi:hypothetical protein